MKHEILIQTLHSCAAHCNHCSDACLSETEVKPMVNCIKSCRECQLICEATASLLAQGSAFSKEMAALCIKACNLCAEECSSHQHMHCEECAKHCRDCAEACAQYLN